MLTTSRPAVKNGNSEATFAHKQKKWAIASGTLTDLDQRELLMLCLHSGTHYAAN